MTGRLLELIPRWRQRSQARETLRALETAGRDLSGISNSTEQVFLEIGKRLAELHGKAEEIAGQAGSIAGMFSKDEGLLGEVGDVLTAARARGADDEIGVIIGQIQGNTRSIHKAINTTAGVVRSFEVLSVVTRIESARFAGAGATFIGLADSVSALSGEIRGQISTTAASAAALLETVSGAAEEMRRVVRKHQDNLGPLTRKISKQLQEIRDHRSRVSVEAKILGQRFEGVSSAIGNVVIALQGHDIVRQQIEHVLEALRPVDSANSRLSHIARLQSAQLNNSRLTFETSVRQVRDSLAQIENNTREMAEDSARILGVSDRSENSFFTTIESGLAEILRIFESDADADRRMIAAAESVKQRLSEIEQTITGVQTIGGQMQRIALNATIEATHLGTAGGALEVVAQAIQSLAGECVTVADTMQDRLTTMSEVVAGLARLITGSSESNACVVRLRQSTEHLTVTQDKAGQAYRKTVQLAADLAREVQEATAIFGTQQDCLEVLARASESLVGIAADCPLANGGGSPLGDIPAYTMESERAVHRMLHEMQGSDDLPQIEPSASVEENVEFF